MHENDIGTIIIDSAIDVHRALGPGLLETVYEVALAHKLRTKGLLAERQVPIAIEYEGIFFEVGFRADLIVNEKVVVELKSKQELSPADRKQIQTYLALTKLKLSYLLNFGAALMKDGIVRAVNKLEEP